ncbi:glutamine amidotransferase [Rhizobiaceae bacterium BDR2-2]|uniref:Glutamine amidotransferase n=1 Tax=Ectorhizobium quercum TaxID=2965071 RepID=A0AAE3N022_9HYPH|nr:type 1 glutamine amidotransferase family protein [Ectorhizobium quercum]MCX8998508.1 glutamine amidotransferase [Ectorhizobium quercum]
MPKLAVLLTDAFADWEAAPLMAFARAYLGVETVTASPGGTPVTSMGGLRVTPDMALDDLVPERFDGLAIIGGMIWETENAPDIGPAVRAFRRMDRAVGGICAGTLAIARTGILRGITHTGNSLAFLAQSEHYHGHSSYLDVPFAVRDGHIVTASGMAPLSFAREMLAALGVMTPEASEHFAHFAEEHCPAAYRKAS